MSQELPWSASKRLRAHLTNSNLVAQSFVGLGATSFLAECCVHFFKRAWAEVVGDDKHHLGAAAGPQTSISGSALPTPCGVHAEGRRSTQAHCTHEVVKAFARRVKSDEKVGGSANSQGRSTLLYFYKKEQRVRLRPAKTSTRKNERRRKVRNKDHFII